jgi:two-component system cell cycle response regulator
MAEELIRVLLVEGDPMDARAVSEVLASEDRSGFLLEQAGTLSSALGRLEAERFDAVLLNLSLPDASGLEVLRQVRSHAPEMAVVVLAERDDQSIAVRAVQEGAQDCLVKMQVEGKLLVRSLRYAIERQRLIAKVRALSLTDELTGLRNRRGFLTLAEQEMKLARRTRQAMALFYADLNRMKWVNDRFGHEEGDRALRYTADLLRQTFRDSDVIARLGGDEFAVLAVGADRESAGAMVGRFHAKRESLNASPSRAYPLSISMGAVFFDSEDPLSLKEMLTRADAMMYDQKRGRDGRATPTVWQPCANCSRRVTPAKRPSNG